MLLAVRVLTNVGGSSYRKMLNYQARDGLDRTERAFQAAQERLHSSVEAVARWEDLRGFFQTPDSVWAADNLQTWAPSSYKLDYLALCDPAGHPIYQWNAPEEAETHLLKPFFRTIKEKPSGLVSTPRDLYILAAGQVRKGEKIIGMLVFGRKVSYRFLLDLNLSPGSDVMVYYGGRLLATTDTSSHLPFLDPAKIFSELVAQDGTYLYQDAEREQVIGFRPLRNIQDLDVAALGWSNRESSAYFVKDAVHNALVYFGIPILALVLITAVILGGWIEKPIRTLSETMEEIRRTRDLTRRAPVTGGGEIASMSRTFNQMLEQLAHQHEELRTFQTMILTMKEGVLIEDKEGNVTYMNPQLEEMLGITSHHWRDSGEPFRLQNQIRTTTRRTNNSGGFITEEVEWTRPDGRRFQALKTSGTLRDPDGKEIGQLSTFLDITERNDLEIELIEASRMAFLGLYTQGIMHNISGPLNTILGFSSLLCKKDPQAEIPQRLHQDARRISDQVSLLVRRWQRTGQQRAERLNLNDIIRDEVKFLEADLFFKHNVTKTFDLDPNLPKITGCYGDFSHALLNLIGNAIEAMLESPVHELTIRTRAEKGEIRIEIQDTGIGIPEEHIGRIFLPFFSTKQRDAKEGVPGGAGLGLAIARKVLEPYAVYFEVRSAVGRGTTMILHIPISEKVTSSETNAEQVEELV